VGPFSDTWLWDGTNWTQSTATPPPARTSTSLFWNPDAGVTMMLGGASAFEELWTWNGTSWSEWPIDVVSTTSLPVAYDAARHQIVRDAQLLQLRTNVAVESCVYATDDYDRDGAAGCADLDCWASCTPLCSPDSPASCAGPHCGDGVADGVADPFEDCRLCPADVGPCTGECGDYVCDPNESSATCPLDC